jgi:thiol-disulfide isomerase/thioredoxin
MRKNVAMLAVVVLLAIVAMVQNGGREADQTAAAPREEAPKLNFLAPSITLSALDKQQYHIGGERDKPLFVNFWASWCGPCELEAPYLEMLSKQYGDRIDFYAVNLTAMDKLDQAQQFAELYKWKFPVLLDLEGKAGELYRIRGIPTSFLIDEKGVIRDGFNYLPPEEMESRIVKLLK